MLDTLLLPDYPGLQIESVVPEGDLIRFFARSTSLSSVCPHCGGLATRVHSRYQRTLEDLSAFGQRVVLQVIVRRFFCSDADCSRRTFSERLSVLTLPHVRKTTRLLERLTAMALVLGGEAGARQARSLCMLVSGDTLLRLIARASVDVAANLQLVGVDEWAWRKGQRYGTIICDLEQRRPVVLLPERSSDSLADWLKDRPQVQVVSRDRSQLYADAVTRGAPRPCRWQTAGMCCATYEKRSSASARLILTCCRRLAGS